MVVDTYAFVHRATRLQRPPLMPELQLYLADEVVKTWRLLQDAQGGGDIEPPFWAFAWAGGQAIARYLLDHPDVVGERSVLDFAAGSGICAIAASRAGAASVLAADIDSMCADVVSLNAKVNGVDVAFTGKNLLDEEPPKVDLIVAGDILYERDLAATVIAWLERAYRAGTEVLIGDPRRDYFPAESLTQMAEYDVPTTRDLEGVTIKRTGVFAFAP